jgi:DNA-binding CsgD family transcriptional regulator
METLIKTDIIGQNKAYCRLMPFDKDIEKYKDGLLDKEELNHILVLKNQFFYITDIYDYSNVFVSDTLTNVLGYLPSDFYNLEFVYECIHPDDIDFVNAFTRKTIAWTYQIADILLKDPFAGVFSIDFRMKNIQDEYIRINRQTSCFKTDHFGNMVYALALFTDINHIKRSGSITYAWKNNCGAEFTIDDLLQYCQKNTLTSREIEIIGYLSQGYSGTQIGKKLFISEYTVIAHRKNILHKVGVKNTAQLIKYAVETGLI